MMTLEQARDLLKISQRELARRAGIGNDTVSRIERGQTDPANVSYGELARIVIALQESGLPGLKIEELFPIERAAV